MFYFVDDGTEAAYQLEHESWVAETFKAHKKTFKPYYAKFYENGLKLPRYLGYMVVEKDLTVRFVEKGRPDKDLQAVMDYCNNLPPKAWFAGVYDLTVPRWSWDGVWRIAKKLQVVTSSTLYITAGVPPDDDYVPEFSKSATISKQGLLEYPYNPDKSAFDSTILNPLPGMVRMDMRNGSAGWSPDEIYREMMQ